VIGGDGDEGEESDDGRFPTAFHKEIIKKST